MKDADRQTRSHLMALFEHHGFHPRTDLGQNFLIDLNLVEFIVDQAHLTKNDVVLEIGAGTGGMTTFLSRWAGQVVSVEIDPQMHALACTAVNDAPNVLLLNQDALKNKNHFHPELLSAISERLAQTPDSQLKLVANLPYSVATPVVSNLVATELPWQRMVITIQWELGLRMTAQPGRSHYGALSVWLAAQCRTKILKRLGPKVFWPRPRVDSAIVLITPDAERRELIADRPFFQDFVRRLFHQRRKRLRAVLVGMYRKQLDKQTIDVVLEEMGFFPNVRAEQLEPPVLVELANHIWHILND